MQFQLHAFDWLINVAVYNISSFIVQKWNRMPLHYLLQYSYLNILKFATVGKGT
jgi:hypothetical protein